MAHELSVEHWRRVMSINLDGTFYCVQWALRQMMAATGGSIVCCSSPASFVAFSSGGASAYSASKGGVSALVRTLAVDYASYGIRVNALGARIDRDTTHVVERGAARSIGDATSARLRDSPRTFGHRAGASEGGVVVDERGLIVRDRITSSLRRRNTGEGIRCPSPGRRLTDWRDEREPMTQLQKPAVTCRRRSSTKKVKSPSGGDAVGGRGRHQADPGLISSGGSKAGDRPSRRRST